MTDISRLQNEAEGDGSVTVALGGHDLRVPPVERWRSSALHAITSGNFEVWAQKTLSAEDYAIWQDVDPTVAEASAFIEDWAAASGSSVGESKASPQRSKRTARR